MRQSKSGQLQCTWEILEMIKQLPTLINQPLETHVPYEFPVPQWLSQKLTELYEYNYSTEMYTKEQIDYIDNIIRKILPLINIDDEDNDNDIKNIILNPNIKNFQDLFNVFKENEVFINSCVEHYFIILQ